MKKIFITVISVLTFAQLVGQNDTIKKNPIWYSDISTGVARFNDGFGLNTSIAFNYQKRKNLLTLRFNQTSILQAESVLFFPILTVKTINSEAGFLYGRRWLKDNQSTSFSLGVSYNKFQDDYNLTTDSYGIETNHFGVPFEANIKWFKSTKKRVYVLGMIPVGKPTGLGGSFGVKLSGNISEQSYVALGVVYSFGYHKYY